MIKKLCLFCGSKTKEVKYNFPAFNHFGFKTVSKRIYFRKCLRCYLVYNPRKIKNIFFNKKKYADETTDHILQKSKKLITRKMVIVKILEQFLKSKFNLKVLEIGCSDGGLLKRLGEKLTKGSFYGTEMNSYNKKKFPKRKNFNLYIKPNLNNLKKKYFNLIILSHVFNYLEDPRKTLMQFKNLLRAGGQMLIVVPNIIENPYYSLMGDQKLVLTKKSLSNLLEKSGFKVKIIKNKYLKRELIVLAKNSNIKKFNYKKDYIFEKSIKKINKIRIKFLKKNIHNPIIFGTSINAACLDEFNKNKTKYFVDEFSKKLNTKFRNKTVIHPNKLKKGDEVIFSFYKNNKLKNKLQKKYLGNIISI